MIFKANDNLFHSMMENLPMAVLLIDDHYRHICTNSLFINLTGLPHALVAGLGWTHWLSAEDKQSLFTILTKMKDFGPAGQQIFHFSHQHAGQSVTIVKGLDPQAGIFYTLAFAIDKKREDAPAVRHKKATSSTHPDKKIRLSSIQKKTSYQESNAVLLASNKHKDKILAIVAHDMNAPIASLKGLTTSLLDTHLDSHERAILRESLLKQLAAVGDLAENVLLWASNSFNRNDSEEKETLNILRVIEDHKIIIEQQANTKGIRISYDIPDDLKIRVNKSQFSMVMRNLFANAIKYTQLHGNVNISVTQMDSRVQIRIVDDGIGISDEHQNHLFTFSQTSTYGTNGEKGIGLGLLLCKQYVEANGGNISIFSKPNMGTTVVTEFPVALSHAFVDYNNGLVWQ